MADTLPEALELARFLDYWQVVGEAAEALRRLHAVEQERSEARMLYEDACISHNLLAAENARLKAEVAARVREPLTDQHIEQIAHTFFSPDTTPFDWCVSVARAIERAHSIGGITSSKENPQ